MSTDMKVERNVDSFFSTRTIGRDVNERFLGVLR